MVCRRSSGRSTATKRSITKSRPPLHTMAGRRPSASRKRRGLQLIQSCSREQRQKQKPREKQRHYYSTKKQLLYETKDRRTGGDDADGAAVTVEAVVRKKRGRPRQTGRVKLC